MIDDSLLYLVKWGPLSEVLLLKKNVNRWIKIYKERIRAHVVLLAFSCLATGLIVHTMINDWKEYGNGLFFKICSVLAAAVVANLIVNCFSNIKDIFLFKYKLAQAVELLAYIEEREKEENL